MERTQPIDWLYKNAVGYVMNTQFSVGNTRILEKLIAEIKAEFNDAVFGMPAEAMHITLLDWVSPLVEYAEKDKAKLFAQVQPRYDKAITEILASIGPINVHFDTIRVSPSTIFIIGHDDGQFQNIRDRFMKNVELLPNAKLPPLLIHSSLARFTESIELSLVQDFVAKKQIEFTQTVSDFLLTHTTKEPNLEFEILKRYQFG